MEHFLLSDQGNYVDSTDTVDVCYTTSCFSLSRLDRNVEWGLIFGIPVIHSPAMHLAELLDPTSMPCVTYDNLFITQKKSPCQFYISVWTWLTLKE